MASFDCFRPAALRFLEDLKANNTRDWFAEHKSTYETELKAPGAAFAEAMSAALTAHVGAPYTAKVFRIHRDVRFSKDKTPYNTHLHIGFSEADAPAAPMWFFGLDTEKLHLGAGVFAFDKAGLERYRDAAAGPAGAKVIALTDAFTEQGYRVSAPELKTIPRGYDRDHPHGEALRRKGLSVWDDSAPRSFVTEPDLVARTLERLTPFLPLRALFREDLGLS